MMTLEIDTPRHDRRDAAIGDVSPRNMVLVASEAPRRHDGSAALPAAGSRPAVAGPNGLELHPDRGAESWAPRPSGAGGHRARSASARGSTSRSVRRRAGSRTGPRTFRTSWG